MQYSNKHDNDIKEVAAKFGLNWLLVKALCAQESSLNPFAMRFEHAWKYAFKVDEFAKSCNTTSKIERRLQMTSVGIMQVMGTVARELSFTGHLYDLCDIKIGLFYGCKKLDMLLKKFPLPDALAAYNAGSGNLEAGRKYSNSVMNILDQLQKDISK
jgi:soluble lytic murein transglycosylase-like protein